ncbi:hypothetical protein Pcinc_010096 [Petrolisthes cinctipes]|uniref:EGF-like domain-containing protein n=1 Tax=Petrolisthes cinctipes TaxID=88211 RepID=A0AAE1G5K0_PETCI|nr:hypothetical protein Pcinc_010096 [Petrolisthes cinctipes]
MVVGVESFFPIMGGFPGNFQLMFPFRNFHGRDDPCINTPCEEGLLCFLDKKPPYYTCSKCPRGYEGDGIICYHPVEDPCASQPCYPGVSCTIQVGPPRTYKCGECPSDLVGDGKTCVESVYRLSVKELS